MALTRARLDDMTCSTPGCENCGKLYFHGACHPGALLEVFYDNGVMTVECGACGTKIADVAVGDSDGNS